jgi:hypothetical protein
VTSSEGRKVALEVTVVGTRAEMRMLSLTVCSPVASSVDSVRKPSDGREQTTRNESTVKTKF